ncbi:Growth arrest/ DNA-damage-inducible protein-interacting protein 1 [Trinorchestia longiramus]|nr:Growth arrest/ DNA-damage-inducible protein-interacting protein 1 [Trinorchestia longiramus]
MRVLLNIRLPKEKQSQLIEEVRLIYGARIDPQDEKFQEILAQKAEEEKKAQKALKKQRKQQAMMEQMKKLIEKAKQTESSTPTVNAEAPVKSPSDVQD